MSPNIVPNVIRPTSPSGACPFALLPHELMAQVFLHLDPHTLYTAVRQLNHQWKITVEEHVIPTLFRTRQWRVALRIHKRPRRVHPNSVQGAQAAAIAQQASRDGGESDKARVQRVLNTEGAWEDELAPPIPSEEGNNITAETITEYLPLTLTSLSPSTNTFHFTTSPNWYALYELGVEPPGIDPNSTAGDVSFRLDLNFGLAWRFEGDGKEEHPQRPGGWTSLDKENRWLSEFWCSTYDLTPLPLRRRSHEGGEGETVRLNATKLARRKRVPVEVPAKKGEKSKTNGSSNKFTSTELAWDDSHIEYLHLDIALGTEFFVRRSARANLLMRALEAEAARREEEDEQQAEREREAANGLMAARGAGKVSASPQPPTGPTGAWGKPLLQKPKATRAGGALSPTPARATGTGTPPRPKSSASSHGKANSPPSALSASNTSGTTSPTPSKSHPDLALLSNSAASSYLSGLSPAEQLQLMAKNKAAAKVAGRRAASGSSTGGSRAGSRAPSRAGSRAASAAPSRAGSRPPSRPGTPSGSAPALSLSSSGAASPSLVPGGTSAHASGHSTPRDRDLPFARALALSQSTASPYTARALSGYATPNPAAASALNPSSALHPAQLTARLGGSGYARGVSSERGSGASTPTKGEGNSFALRGGGGAQPGGTPFAQFKGRLRLGGNGFERLGAELTRKRTSKKESDGTGRRRRERSETMTAERWNASAAGDGVAALSLGSESEDAASSSDEEVPAANGHPPEEKGLDGIAASGELGWTRAPVPYEGEGMMRTWREAKLLGAANANGPKRRSSLRAGAEEQESSDDDEGEVKGAVETQWIWSR
ncbi:hypothetical protein BDZ90DRAFT_234592 [Jaminaea rosea]|uniref:F-box domain-containing protein n=1 Tax=Jaminaea rosea TaxID=1569628 RepID=A0A316UPC2_9BASI|nr:hypothetical protein BDZ90DRAFT_234592 [Jaminaea rosea]PWN24985.1 hypothetical protein BDZ90DRAFT_234592 [Jaminaea rosea]